MLALVDGVVLPPVLPESPPPVLPEPDEMPVELIAISLFEILDPQQTEKLPGVDATAYAGSKDSATIEYEPLGMPVNL